MEFPPEALTSSHLNGFTNFRISGTIGNKLSKIPGCNISILASESYG